MIEIVSQIPEQEWNRFLGDTNGSILYHTHEWKIFLERTFDYSPHYLFVTDDSGQVIGLLPLFHIKSRLTGNRLCSLPFSHICGPLGESASRSALIEKAIEIRDLNHIDTIELRSPSNYRGFQETHSFCTHILNLYPNPTDVWKRLDKGSVRWAVTKSRKLGVTVTTSTDIEDLREFYELNCVTKRSLGVPCHPWKFFENLFSVLGNHVHLYLAKQKDRIIAGGIMECYKDKILYGYGAADPDSLHLHPYHAFIWKSIEDACQKGYRVYDFGRTSLGNTGLIQFKKKWGAQKIELGYSNYPCSHQCALSTRDSTSYRIGNSIISRMPMPVYTQFSSLVFSHFG